MSDFNPIFARRVLAGPKGDTGADGPAGADGAAGATGAAGSDVKAHVLGPLLQNTSTETKIVDVSVPSGVYSAPIEVRLSSIFRTASAGSGAKLSCYVGNTKVFDIDLGNANRLWEAVFQVFAIADASLVYRLTLRQAGPFYTSIPNQTNYEAESALAWNVQDRSDINLIDSGSSQTVSMYIRHTSPNANSWTNVICGKAEVIGHV